MSEAAVAGTAPCILEPRPHIWDLGGRMTATFADKSNPGECGREYHLCITLGSRDCCGKVGFVYGSCDAYTLTVSPPQTDGP